jgi:DNA-directed RNA polymerase specialized sigma subunit
MNNQGIEEQRKTAENKEGKRKAEGMILVTEQILGQYRAIKNEIEDLSFRIKRVEEKGVPMVSDRVRGSSRHFPYIEKYYYITGVDVEEDNKRRKLIQELQRKRNQKLDELLELESIIHDYIYEIPDSEVRQIFIFRYIDGLSQEEIGMKLHMDRSGVSKRITKYLDRTDCLVK